MASRGGGLLLLALIALAACAGDGGDGGDLGPVGGIDDGDPVGRRGGDVEAALVLGEGPILGVPLERFAII